MIFIKIIFTLMCPFAAYGQEGFAIFLCKEDRLSVKELGEVVQFKDSNGIFFDSYSFPLFKSNDLKIGRETQDQYGDFSVEFYLLKNEKKHFLKSGRQICVSLDGVIICRPRIIFDINDELTIGSFKSVELVRIKEIFRLNELK